MLPSAFMFLKTLPLTPNGKIDRKALPRPEQQNVGEEKYQPPKGETEQKLAKIITSVLKISRVSRNDSFFDLGGHSILAVKYFISIEEQFGIRLPLATLFRAPSIELIGLELDKKRKIANDWQSLVPINTKGTRNPLFLVHGAEGNILIYRSLALHLGEDQPVYGFQAAGLDGSGLGEVDFEKVAYGYIKEILKIQPDGPYLLGGYCLGGTIALEMAHQLKNLGKTVSLVAMFENYNIKTVQWPLPTSVKFGNKILNVYYHFLNLISARGGRISFLKEKLEVEIYRAKISARLAWVKLHNFMGGKSDILPHQRVEEAFDDALMRYEIKPYSERVALFLTIRCLLVFNDPKGGWADTIREGLEIYTLQGNPRASMTEPYVRDLAVKLRALLDETKG
jgi:thioesterase domain-containing protein/acyl carrier protein